MHIPLFAVETGGLLTTVQDLGRSGHQREGLPVAGAMDPLAASVANLLLGNSRTDAVLEITLLGPSLRVLADIPIALCGGDLSAAADGLLIPAWKTVLLKAGQRLTFGRRRAGARVYLAVAGGFAVPLVLGSRATFLRGEMGGFEGRRLQAGDILTGLTVNREFAGRGLRPADIPTYPLPAVLRVVPGPHLAAFPDAGPAAFFSAIYTVTPQSDRQGYRLSGPVVERVAGSEILSEAMPLGGIQIPPDGQPILLMADRQTTGGYPLMGVVASADISLAAQLAPGDVVQFEAMALTQAQEWARRQERWLRIIEGGFCSNSQGV